MEYQLRKTDYSSTDAHHLSVVERLTLADSGYHPDDMRQVIRLPEHHTYLAYAADQPVGFCSCFETPADQGTRLEIDMLGVLEQFRCQGLATRLVSMALQDAQARGVRSFRAVVALDNLGSQKTFERAGLHRSANPCKMLVFESRRSRPDREYPEDWQCRVETEGIFHTPGDEHTTFYASGPTREAYRLMQGEALLALGECLSVQTLAYCGLWVEKLWAVSPEALGALALGIGRRAEELGLDEAGYLMPDLPDQVPHKHALLDAGYCWWQDYWIYKAGPE